VARQPIVHNCQSDVLETRGQNSGVVQGLRLLAPETRSATSGRKKNGVNYSREPQRRRLQRTPATTTSGQRLSTFSAPWSVTLVACGRLRRRPETLDGSTCPRLVWPPKNNWARPVPARDGDGGAKLAAFTAFGGPARRHLGLSVGRRRTARKTFGGATAREPYNTAGLTTTAEIAVRRSASWLVTPLWFGRLAVVGKPMTVKFADDCRADDHRTKPANQPG